MADPRIEAARTEVKEEKLVALLEDHLDTVQRFHAHRDMACRYEKRMVRLEKEIRRLRGW